jgi:hypothetical protein
MGAIRDIFLWIEIFAKLSNCEGRARHIGMPTVVAGADEER